MGTTVGTAVTKAVRALATGGELETILAAVLTQATEGLGFEAAIAYLFDEDREILEPATMAGTGSDVPLAVPVADPASAVARAARERREVIEEGRRFVPLLLGDEGGILRGVLEARGAVDEPEAISGLAALADLTAIAVERSRLRSAAAERSEWFERLSEIDPLTGLANRLTFERALELELVRAARQGTSVALVIFDISGLAKLNEQLGPAAGDDALRRAAAVITENVRLVDTVARYGAHEFVVVAPGATGPALANRIVAGAAAELLDDGSAITLRAGMAFFPEDGTTAGELAAAAERALREATA